MAFSSRARARLYTRLYARVRRARTEADRIRARFELAQKFPKAVRLSEPARRIADRARRRLWKIQNPERHRELQNRSGRKLKLRVVARYTNNAPRCQYKQGTPEWCPVVDIDDLELDHIDADWSMDVNPDGTRMSGRTLWLKIVKENFPPRFQVLCIGHNIAKGPRAYSIRNGTHPVVQTWGFAGGRMQPPPSGPTPSE